MPDEDRLVDWYDCSGKEDGDYPHPDGDTTKFMSCVARSHAYERNCPPGTHFDPEQGKCV
ncbi:carbohydrate-binding module family 14 protein [Nocardia sp. NPDC049526]|uniref:carbohydrate-binding module family 14 protein n=1 Tax=Nocardia sp. NPDC049526 TaxID=3364316 RepID=UPI0037A6CD82